MWKLPPILELMLLDTQIMNLQKKNSPCLDLVKSSEKHGSIMMSINGLCLIPFYDFFKGLVKKVIVKKVINGYDRQKNQK